MTEKKYKHITNKYCLWFLCLFIVSGCTTTTKRNQIVGIQKVRIKKLEQRIKKQDKLIAKLKAQKWAKKPVKKSSALALKPLKAHIKNKQWVAALKLSGELKKQYPRSLKLAKYRVAIFRQMGLEKQAIKEINEIKKLRAKNKSRRRI